jgi:hypothetical protein
MFIKIRKAIIEIIKYRDTAVHPSQSLKNACNRDDIKEGVDRIFAMYNFKNCKTCYESTKKILSYLHQKKSENEKVNKNIENIFKALIELKVIKEKG